MRICRALVSSVDPSFLQCYSINSSHLSSPEFKSVYPQLCKIAVLCLGSPSLSNGLELLPQNSQGDHETDLLCFLFSRILVFCCLLFQCLKAVVQCFLSSFLVVYGRRLGLFPFIPVWLEMKVSVGQF